MYRFFFLFEYANRNKVIKPTPNFIMPSEPLDGSKLSFVSVPTAISDSKEARSK